MKCRLLSLVVVGFLLTALMGAPSHAAMNMKFGHVAPPFHGQSKGAEAFAEYVKTKTNGAIDIKTFPFGQLGGEVSLAEQVQSGTLEIATISTAVLQNFVPQLAVMDLPFAYPDRKTAYAVLDDPEVQKKIFGLLPAKGIVGVGWTENEFRDITNSKREIRKPEDLKGLKIRVMNSPIYIDTFKELGASPTDLPFPEIYSALQNGTIDAQENPLLTSILIKATEINKFVTLSRHMLTECIIIVNQDVWNKLTDEQKKIFYEAGAKCIQVNREVDVELMKKLPKSGLSVEEYCKQNDVKVVELTDAERQAFKEAVKGVWEKYQKVIGQELFDFFMKKVAAHTQQ
uniref:DctP family TRAP transporter solute-binding subunit n=1 Tax=Desulfomonile tiedjei TaxID=2358 RepID=A0A7C4ASR1_9BACT